MAIEQDKLGLEVYKILAAKDYGYNLAIYDTAGEGTTTPLKAKWIYVKPVNFMVQLPDPEKQERPEMYFWKQQGIHDEVIEQLIERIRAVTNQFGVGLTVNDFARENTPKQFAQLVKRHNEEQAIEEGREYVSEGMVGSSRRSYYVLENARMVAIHSKKINEEIHGSRGRNIKEIYVESKGERFKFPVNYLQGARAMTRHMNEGGTWSDGMGKQLRENCMALVSMNKLVKECVHESATLYAKARQHVNEVKKDMKKAQGPRGYRKVMEKYSNQARISQQAIQERCQSLSALSGLNESDELLEAYKYLAVRDLREDKVNESLFTSVISEMCQVDARSARPASRAITKGQVGFKQPPKFAMRPQDAKQRVLIYASALAECIDDDLVSVALSEIAEAANPTPDDAKFVAGVYKSAKLREFQQPQSNEVQELMDWFNDQTKDML